MKQLLYTFLSAYIMFLGLKLAFVLESQVNPSPAKLVMENNVILEGFESRTFRDEILFSDATGKEQTFVFTGRDNPKGYPVVKAIVKETNTDRPFPWVGLLVFSLFFIPLAAFHLSPLKRSKNRLNRPDIGVSNV